MVQFRGINVSAVSQIDARPLPEYSTASDFPDSGGVAACYLPIYPGSQIWFEYSIDGPHPKNAMYLFKLFMDGHLVTSWDCTEKHGYHGKAAYSLHTVKNGNYGERAVAQQSFMFSTASGRESPSMKNDYIEMRIHRIQHRRRVRDLPLDPSIPKQLQGANALRLVDGGLIEQDRPARRYQYQLLDSKNEPYAIFRFYCRTKDYLERHQILDHGRSQSSKSSGTSGSYCFETYTSPKARRIEYAQELVNTKSAAEGVHTAMGDARKPTSATTKEHAVSACPQTQVLPLASLSSVAARIKDSIEDLPSMVPRSPQLDEFGKRLSLRSSSGGDDGPPAPTLSRPAAAASQPLSPTHKVPHIDLPSPLEEEPHSPTRLPHQTAKRNKLNLTLTLNGATFDLERKRTRPLSPFTSGGFLRRLVSTPEPLSAPATVTNIQPTFGEVAADRMKEMKLADSARSQQKAHSSKAKVVERTTRAQRNGHFLIGFLGRRIDRRSAT